MVRRVLCWCVRYLRSSLVSLTVFRFYCVAFLVSWQQFGWDGVLIVFWEGLWIGQLRLCFLLISANVHLHSVFFLEVLINYLGTVLNILVAVEMKALSSMYWTKIEPLCQMVLWVTDVNERYLVSSWPIFAHVIRKDLGVKAASYDLMHLARANPCFFPNFSKNHDFRRHFSL